MLQFTFMTALVSILGCPQPAQAESDLTGSNSTEPESTKSFQNDEAQRGITGDALQLASGDLLVFDWIHSKIKDTERISPMIMRVDSESGKSLGTFATSAKGYRGASLDPNGTLLALSTKDGFQIMPLAAGLDGTDSEVIARREQQVVSRKLPKRPSGGTLHLDWTSDGTHLVTWTSTFLHGPPTSKVQIWKRSGELLWDGPVVNQVSVHPTTNRICAVMPDKVILGWPDSDTAKSSDFGVQTLRIPGVYDSIQFSPDGKRIAVGGTDPDPSKDSVSPGNSGGSAARLWILDAATGLQHFSLTVKGIDSFEFKQWLHFLSWSPDGSMLGVSLGKGHAVGIISATNGNVVWTGDHQGGRMWEKFDVGWTAGGRFLTGWGQTLLLNPKQPGDAIPIEKLARSRIVELSGTDDVLLFFDANMVRMDPITGKRRWTRKP